MEGKGPMFSVRNMAEAMTALNSLQAKGKEALTMSILSRAQCEREMHVYLDRLQLDISSLSVIHVAGTKGKGSTCALTESILRAHGVRTGLFTSPHLVHIGERFRLNGQPVSEPDLLRSFWAVWDRLEATRGSVSSSAGGGPTPMPSFFRFITLVAFHLFLALEVEVLVLEVGLGGALDATNVVPKPIVCGVALLDYDHTAILGKTLTKIATEKAGILKAGVPAFSVEQPPEAQRALEAYVTAHEVVLKTVQPLPPSRVTGALPTLGLLGRHQLQNAGLAVRLSHAWLTSARTRKEHQDRFESVVEALDPASLPDLFLRGLAQCHWAGRCHILTSRSPGIDRGTPKEPSSLSFPPNLSLFIDGAHTSESMAVATEWFAEQCKAPASEAPDCASSLNVLLFNCGHERNPFELFEPFAALAKQTQPVHFGEVVLCPFDHDRVYLNDPPPFDQLLAGYRQTLADRGRMSEAEAKHLFPDAAPTDRVDPSPERVTWQRTVAKVWQSQVSVASQDADGDAVGCASSCLPSAHEAMEHVFRLANGNPKRFVRVFVTGSLYLVGNVLGSIGYREDAAQSLV